MNYDWKCPDCEKCTSCSTTDDDLENYDELECPWCGRVSKVINHTVTFYVEQTNKKVSPTELEKLNEIIEKNKVKVK
jgi:NAD-dependent SIR2 family protein deacetylase